jgi:peptidoglycan hydrolase FlgJ
MPLSDEQKQSLALIAAAAAESEAATGVPAELVAAQCAIESGWLKYFAAPNNALGIKKAARHADGVFAATTEHVQGVAERTMAKFASFATLTECFEDHAHIITSVPMYRRAWEGYMRDKSLEALVRNIAPVYATDPGYAAKVLAVMAGPDFCAAIETARKARVEREVHARAV